VGGVWDYRHYIYAGNEPVAIASRKSSGTNTLYYLLSDHQGSVTAITNSAGGVVVGESFAAYGSRRNPTTWSGAPSGTDLTTIAGISRNGYTFQQALANSMGLNDMVGRVQDAITGRFLSADPRIPDIENPQDYNRYSYTDNNPLTYTDPTGFDSDSLVQQDGGGAEVGLQNASGGAFEGVDIQASSLPDGDTYGMASTHITSNTPNVDASGGDGASPKVLPLVAVSASKLPPDPPLQTIVVGVLITSIPQLPPQMMERQGTRQCNSGTTIGNALVFYGKQTAAVGSVATAFGTAVIAGGAVVTSTVVGAPEGAAVMATGSGIAGAGMAYSFAGLGMEALGGVINAVRGKWGSLESTAMQGAAAAIDWGIGKGLPQLPDLMGPSNPVDAAADSISERLDGGGTCP
jgi:RHS repeat-associated protein